MDFLNKTLFANSEEDLKKIYDEEYKKLSKNELILECLTKLTIQDFPSNISAESKKNIDYALLSVRISDYIDLDNGQTLLVLENFQLSKINLSYSEKKMIREKVEELVNNELKRRNAHSTTDSLEKKIDYEQNKFLELEKENRKLIIELEQLKKEEQDLMIEVANIFIGSDQKQLVNGLKQDVEILDQRTKKFIDITEHSECNRTKYSHKVLQEISTHLDELIEKKNSEN
ncbi:augmin complex subunit dgt2 [Chironomus tepperi]|uniref:augmin complex subunit dgt2 n=1 Tax=Chironomus tepperi TaxID=113505 RepID=UPI00391F9E4D